MNTSTFLNATASQNSAYTMAKEQQVNSINTSSLTHLSTGLKSVDILVQRYGIHFHNEQSQLSDNAFQKSLILYGQDQRLDYINLPPCMYMIISQANADQKFVIHRFYLPFKNGVRFATYLLNGDGDVIESVSYQRNAKYLQAFKIIRKQIVLANQLPESMVA